MAGRVTKTPLSKDRVLRAAVEVADEGGIESLTMRHLAEVLGVEAMSLYYHVANKEALLDGVVDLVAGELNEATGTMNAPSAREDWKTALRMQILTAREIMLAHIWAPGVIESRTTMSPETVRYYETVLGVLREGGFTYDVAHHALHALGSRALGFTQELFAPDDAAGQQTTDAVFEDLASQLPHLVGMLTEIAHDDPDSTLGWCDDQTEFEFGLDLILDGLERLRLDG